jgi:hypothetical protein
MHLVFFLCFPLILVLLITMADVGVINLDDATMVEKHGRGRPRGSKKNNPKASAADASSSTPSSTDTAVH